MPKLTIQTKKLTYKCARCFITETDKLAWFVGNTLFNESFLSRPCWQGQFNRLTERERKEWGFYVPKKPR